MSSSVPQIILASKSPRRKQLLEQLGWSVICQAVDVDETPIDNEKPVNYCKRITLAKAQAAQTVIQSELPILTADTTVVLQQKILGKPSDELAAFNMLKSLSGVSHQVITVVAISYQGETLSVVNQNKVKFAKINEAEIKAYIATGEPMDKAGSYGIQGFAAMWIEKIEGSYSGIMGLPLYETTQLFKKVDIITPLDV
ncbi:MAG: Maf family protein [Marinicella sp.]|nr:septum formation inhibitor Maf [Xanthomonadales bacterium]